MMPEDKDNIVIQEKILELTKKINELEEKIDKANKLENDNEVELINNVDHIYNSSLKYYEKSVNSVKWHMSIFFMLITLISGLVKYDNDRQLDKQEERIDKEIRDSKILRLHNEAKIERISNDLEVEIKKIRNEFKEGLAKVEFNYKLGFAINKPDDVEKVRGLKKIENEELINLKDEDKAKLYLALGDYVFNSDEKIGYYSKLIELDSNLKSDAYKNRGVTKMSFGLDEEAIGDYNEAIKLDESSKEAYYNKGVAYLNLGNDKEAIKNFNIALSLDRKYKEAYYDRGFVHLNSGKYNEAIKDYSEVISLYKEIENEDSKERSLRRIKDEKDEFIGLDERAIFLYSGAYYNRGLAYYDLGEYNEAISDNSKAIKLDPNFISAYYNKGLAYLKLNNYNEAIREYSKAIELDYSFIEAYYALGLIYLELDNYNEAIKNCSKVIELNPNFIEAYYARGIAYSSLGDDNEAIKDYSRVIELNSEFEEIYQNRAEIYLKDKEFFLALNDLIKIMKMNTNYELSISISQEIYNEFKKILKDKDKNELEEIIYKKLIEKEGFNIIISE